MKHHQQIPKNEPNMADGEPFANGWPVAGPVIGQRVAIGQWLANNGGANLVQQHPHPLWMSGALFLVVFPQNAGLRVFFSASLNVYAQANLEIALLTGLATHIAKRDLLF